MIKVTVDGEELAALTTAEVAEVFGVGKPTVWRWVQLGKLHPGRTPGGDYRFPSAEIARLLEAARGQS